MTNKKAPTVIKIGDPDELRGKGKSFGGSLCNAWNDHVGGQAANTYWFGHVDGDVEAINDMKRAAIHAMLNMRPKDPIEGMILAQMIGAHNAAMECYRRAMISDQPPDGRAMNLAHAGKLSRTYCALTEALNRHRGKGQQTVRVEHVTVQAGAQAIVGNVSAGGGAVTSREGQPYAITDTHEPALWFQDEARVSVPVASNEERPVPDARRPKSRCA